MNRNVTILIIILLLLLMVGYLLWLRGRFPNTKNEAIIAPTPQVTSAQIASPSATPITASPSATATPSGKISPTNKPTKTVTVSGSKVR